MAIWLIRAGSHGEFEQKFLQEGRVYVTWDRVAQSLEAVGDRDALAQLLTKYYPDAKPKRVQNWVSQLWPFAHEMKKGDLVVLPSKRQPAINIGELTGDYHFESKGPNPFYHWRPVKWIGEAIPRTHFGQDLLYTFGAFLTICRVQRNNAEARILAMRANGWKAESLAVDGGGTPPKDEEALGDTDLEQLGLDRIAQLVEARFKGHELTRLVEAILNAQGYSTYRSPEGADGGADILAGAGALGFETRAFASR